MSSKKTRNEEPTKAKVAARDAEAEDRDEAPKGREADDDPTDDEADEGTAENDADDDTADDEPIRRAPRAAEAREQPRFSLTTLVAVSALVGAGAFAAGRSMAPSDSEGKPAPAVAAEPQGMGGGMGMGAPQGNPPGEALPPGHPPMGEPPPATAQAPSAEEPAAMTWKAPARWQSVPNPSTMRLATFKVPRAAGDAEDAEVAISQAGGSVDANVQRWIGQFGPEAAKTAKRSTRDVRGLKVSLVEVEGTFSGGMAKDGKEATGWAMIGAIVETRGMPHFVKMTGPAKSVKAAKAELDEFLASVAEKPSK